MKGVGACKSLVTQTSHCAFGASLFAMMTAVTVDEDIIMSSRKRAKFASR
jgi:hypothetical protein